MAHHHHPKQQNQGNGGTQNTGAKQSQDQGSTMDRARDMASSAMEKAQGLASSATEQAQNLMSQSRDIAGNLGEKAGQALSSVGEQIHTLASNLRERVPQEGMLGSAAAMVADGLETGSQYIQQQNFDDMMEDVSTVIRRYPIQSVLIGMGVGFLVAKTLRS